MVVMNFKWIYGQCFCFALILISYLVPIPSEENRQSVLYNSLKSNHFGDATLIAVGVSSQILLHMVLETLAPNGSLKHHIGTRWTGNLAYALTNVIIWLSLRCDVISGKIYFMLMFIMMSVFAFGHVSALNAIYPGIWTGWKSFGIITMVSLHYLFSYHDNHALRFSTIFGALAFTTYVLASGIILQTCFAWYIKYLYKRKFADLEQKEKVLVPRIRSLIAWFVGISCIIAYYRDTNLEDFDVVFVTTFSYAVSGNVVLYSIAYARKLHFEAAEVSVRYALLSIIYLDLLF